MAWDTDSPRHVTKEQFSDGTTVDGNRIERAMDELASYFNAIPLGGVRRRLVANTYCSGWSPMGADPDTVENNQHYVGAAGADITHHWPWLPAYNEGDISLAPAVNGSTPSPEPVGGIQNPYRHKGIRSGLGDAHPKVDQYAWTTSFYFTAPAIITTITLWMMVQDDATGDDYRNDFTWKQAEGDHVANEWTHDFALQLSVDSRLAPEDRTQNAVEINKWEWGLDASSFSYHGSQNAPPAPSTDMSLADAGDEWGVVVDLENLSVLIPAHSRVRVSVLLPVYTDSPDVDGNPWREHTSGTSEEWERAFFNQQMNLNMTVLEEISG